jgi:hypothetical protein
VVRCGAQAEVGNGLKCHVAFTAKDHETQTQSYLNQHGVASHTQTNRSTTMAQSETNGHMLNANISAGHDDQSSPSHPPLGRGEAMCVGDQSA